MARARNIKPSFFTNDELAEIEPLGRLFFIGLWTIADHKGCFEYREKKLKAQILPYDNCDIKKIMINLDKSGFIISYSDGEKIYAKITNFEAHQHPHPNEIKKGSNIPNYTLEMRQLIDLEELTINHDKSRFVSDDSITNPSDSLLLNPDSLIPSEDESPDDEVEDIGSENKFSEDDLTLARFMFKKIQQLNPKTKEPNYDKWADTIRLLRERDSRTHKEIQDVFLWANDDEFWKVNILSPTSLREKFDALQTKRIQGLQKTKQKNFINDFDPAYDDYL